MKMRNYLLLIFLTLYLLELPAQEVYKSVIKPLPNEKWWGALTALGSQMPFEDNLQMFDLSKNNLNNQVVPLMLSSQGRFMWAEEPFRFEVKDGEIIIYSDYEEVAPVIAGTTLKDAQQGASATHFPSCAKIPEPLFFSMPQYNTWIELMYNQNQADIMNYARQVTGNGFPAGVFMIDDNWQRYYGNFDFKLEKFPDAKGMTDTLHYMGFKVMVWIAPYVSADSPEFRILREKGYLLKQKNSDNPALIDWWNGLSACYDVTNPDAVKYLAEQLRDSQKKYGIDGFKFDGGDVAYMQGEYDFFDKNATVNDFSQKWAELGLQFPFNEFRTSWKLGGQPIVQRLGDKNYSWNAAQLLIPDMITAGLLGHYYTCPDMIGGGQNSAFENLEPGKFNEELIVRSCQIHALMPMMQFSVAPWRVLSKENMEICAHYAHLHQEMGSYILAMAQHAALTGEPIVRHMEYEFPHQGFTTCKDQFMLGDKYLVAPMVTSGTSRTVALPRGVWKDDQGEKIKGPKNITIDVPLNRLPYFEKIK